MSQATEFTGSPSNLGGLVDDLLERQTVPSAE